jgi:hypothetical protein
LEKKEEGVNTVAWDLRKNQKEMTIHDRLRSTQDLKNLQAKLKNVQAEKQLRQAQLDPPQEGAE